ncbi:MAG TPA: GNAT family N-acetyltransferase [Propionibacteriaceae bacterium]|nr:GNAT family N-acetyltransferase [Propionibacteriaceae bacterium]
MAASNRRLNTAYHLMLVPYHLMLVPLAVGVARRMLIAGLRPERVESHSPPWHPEYPLPDSLDAIAMAFGAHQAMGYAVAEPPAWWVHQIVVDGVVVGDIGFHGPPGPEKAVEIGYSVVPAWRRRGVASWACSLILQQAWRDGAESVIAETDHDNVASQAVLLANGFRRRPDGVFMITRPEAE